MRKVIFHYHLFKNAGTSLDSTLKENFREDLGEWVTREFPANQKENREQVRQWIIDNPTAKCFSSHTAIFPVPEIEGVEIIPIIFLRNPIDRVVSAYNFEKKQGGNGFGPTLARNTSLSGYIETRLSLSYDRQCSDFQAHRLSTFVDRNDISELDRARFALKELPFVGIVESYNDSLIELESLLKSKGFQDIKLNVVEHNVTQDKRRSLEEKLTKIKEDLGSDIYNHFEEKNSVDLKIWSEAQKKR